MPKDKVERISEDTLNRLVEAASSAEADIANGAEPQKAFLDAAKAYDLTPEQTKLLVRGWNITNFTDKLGSSKKLEDRCADIPVVHFDELEKFLKDSIKTASNETVTVWHGYYAPPERRIKRAYQKDPLGNYEKILETDNFFVKVAGVNTFVKKNFNRIIDLRKQASAALKSLISEFQLKFASLKSASRLVNIPKDVVLGNLRTVNPLAAKIAADAFAHVKQARLEGRKADYSFSPNKEPYSTALKCASLMESIDKGSQLLQKLEKIWSGFHFEDKVAEKQARWAVESMEISPLVGGVYSGQRLGFFHNATLDVEDPDFFVFERAQSGKLRNMSKFAKDDKEDKNNEDDYEEKENNSPKEPTEDGVLGSTLFDKAPGSSFEFKSLPGVAYSMYSASSAGWPGGNVGVNPKPKDEKPDGGGESNPEGGGGKPKGEKPGGQGKPSGPERKQKNNSSSNQNKSRLGKSSDTTQKIISIPAGITADIIRGATDIHMQGLEGTEKNISAVERFNAVKKSLNFIKNLSLATELMAADPRIADYSLEEVLNAVTLIRELSPALPDNLLLLRNFTIKVLEQGGMLDLNDIVALSKLFQKSDNN